jgi:predicted heme/steroid binding protein
MFKAVRRFSSKPSMVSVLESETRKFTLEELKQFNGQGGKPAYIAFKGKVYDVSENGFWVGGDHLGAHQAGKDLTVEMDLAPHREETLERVKIVGILL